jgi:hypothetical protein
MRRPTQTLVVLLIAALPLLVAGIAQADRKPTGKERRQVAKVLQVPPECAAVRISTETAKPKWASVSFKPAGSECEPFASDGVIVAKKSKGRWRAVVDGSSFDCPSLYKAVPRAVAEDLGITCH